jgi:hypothetical protein
MTANPPNSQWPLQCFESRLSLSAVCPRSSSVPPVLQFERKFADQLDRRSVVSVLEGGRGNSG